MNSGFSYTLSDEKIIEYMDLSIEEKLKWLEEINELTYLVLSESEKKARELLRLGTWVKSKVYQIE